MNLIPTLRKAQLTLRWFPAFLWQWVTRQPSDVRPLHLIIGLADHFEPAIVPMSAKGADLDEQLRRLDVWCERYPRLVDPWRDCDGIPFRHTYFYPAEQYNQEVIERLVDHCRAGWGEIEVHLHHGVNGPDTAEHTRQMLVQLRDALTQYGRLSRLNGTGTPRYAFVHGNWALANSANGACCGVDSEMQILAETGCYADFTLPAAPSPAQIRKINSMYECDLPLDQRAPHRQGRDLAVGRVPTVLPIIIQGPLLLSLGRSNGRGLLPRIENSEISSANPATLRRLRLWRQTNIVVRGRPDWVFIKLHCHGMDPRDEPAMLGSAMESFLRSLKEAGQDGDFRVHYVTAREMVNILFAACEGREGNPGDYRDYRFRLIGQGGAA